VAVFGQFVDEPFQGSNGQDNSRNCIRLDHRLTRHQIQTGFVTLFLKLTIIILRAIPASFEFGLSLFDLFSLLRFSFQTSKTRFTGKPIKMARHWLKEFLLHWVPSCVTSRVWDSQATKKVFEHK